MVKTCHTHSFLFFFNDTATTEIYTLSLHDALPILRQRRPARATGGAPGRRPGNARGRGVGRRIRAARAARAHRPRDLRSEEHTSELQSRLHLVCRLLLEKKKMTLTDDWSIVVQTRR